jgi:hypothetical protein
MDKARMVRDTDEDAWDVYVGDVAVLRQESYQAASLLEADLNGGFCDPTSEIADGIRKSLAAQPTGGE